MEWISVEEKEPPKDNKFIATNRKEYWVCQWYEDGHPINGEEGYVSVICTCCNEESFHNMTHWMPLPNPPACE